eukprot:CCRYP_018899-RE/>CCRYP_018899-RE protein AED:0.10 eAED:0.10 QI:455/0.55/0.8/1/0.55/0.7/10/382/1227
MKILSLSLVSNVFSVVLVLTTAKDTSAATCGGGNRGDGFCANGGCCSEWGWCVTDESCGYNNSDLSRVLPNLAPTASTAKRTMHVRKMKLQMTVATSRYGAIDTSELGAILASHLRILLKQNLHRVISDDVKYETLDVQITALTIVHDELFRHLSSIAKEPVITHVRALGRVVLPGITPILFLNEIDSMIRSAFDGEEFLDRLHDAEDPALRSSVQVWRGFRDGHTQTSPSPTLAFANKVKNSPSIDYSSWTSGYDETKKLPIDYTIFGIVVVTLSLLLVVEVLRHGLDVIASGNLFFETVLELMYREPVFVDVHFMLCYTAIFNAIQSVLLRLITSRRAEKAWVETENVEISHYVAIRKEFDRVTNKLKQLRYKCNERIPTHSSTETQAGRIRTLTRLSHWSQKVRHPNLTRRKYKLLVPIRFHELRIHLIAQNNLPPKFKVSHYLKSSLTDTLLEFVHISSSVWIMLMITANLIYFASGMILYFSESQSTLPGFLVGTFIAIMALCWGVALLLFFKMKDIFEHILIMPIPRENDDTGTRISQVCLFWGGNPRFVIILTQYMQFGFALGLAACVTYWKELYSASYSHTNVVWMLPVVAVSYVLFQPLLADILEWYTLCTSVGQLVNIERLHKALARHKLDEEIKKQESREEEKKIEEAISMNDLPEITPPESNHKDLARFFESYKYQILSFLMGPMTCCFLVGRVEGFVIAEEILSNDLNTFQFSLSTSFWLEIACYCWMAVELFITLAVFVKRGSVQGIFAASFGIFINIICLSVLIIAEMMRCCSENGNVIVGYMTFAEPNDGCCSNFGERTDGGLGHVEPFTCLISLSSFRYLVARLIFRVRSRSHHDHKSNNENHNHRLPDTFDRARALWFATFATHSDIAEKYGMFSSQILQVMLGIDVPRHELREMCIDRVCDPEYLRFKTENSTQSRYSRISVATSTHGVFSSRSTLHSSPGDSFHMTSENENFDYPAACLVLDVCRCECKLLPLLEEWILVDVILTYITSSMIYCPRRSHELIVFGVKNGDCSSDDAAEVLHGSSGLRLSDVAQGRYIVSQFSLRDIDHLNIEQMLATPHGKIFDCRESHLPGGLVSNNEFRRNERWMSVSESRLKIHFSTGCGTLLLRFLADLNENESCRKDISLNRKSPNWLLSTVGSQVKLWCRTIARLRGESNLKMSLPHFGCRGGVDELEDFIQIIERGDTRRQDSLYDRCIEEQRQHRGCQS